MGMKVAFWLGNWISGRVELMEIISNSCFPGNHCLWQTSDLFTSYNPERCYAKGLLIVPLVMRSSVFEMRKFHVLESIRFMV